MLKELNASGRRKLPEDAPTDFLSQRLKPIVINQGEIDRRAWECAVFPYSFRVIVIRKKRYSFCYVKEH
jgi:hypothetical protein